MDRIIKYKLREVNELVSEIFVIKEAEKLKEKLRILSMPVKSSRFLNKEEIQNIENLLETRRVLNERFSKSKVV